MEGHPCTTPSSRANSVCQWVKSPGANLASHLQRCGLQMWEPVFLWGRIWRCYVGYHVWGHYKPLLVWQAFGSRILAVVAGHLQLALCTKLAKGSFIRNNYSLLKLQAFEKRVEPNITHMSQHHCSKRMKEGHHILNNTVKEERCQICQIFHANTAWSRLVCSGPYNFYGHKGFNVYNFFLLFVFKYWNCRSVNLP